MWRLHPSLRPRPAAGVPPRAEQPPVADTGDATPEPMAPGSRVAREDYDEYVRGGVLCNLFVPTEPLAGWRRHVVVVSASAAPASTSPTLHQGGVGRRALLPRGREEDSFGYGQPQHPHSSVPLRSLRAHAVKRLSDRLKEIYYTPKHGSLLAEHMTEIELSVLCEQCLDRRLCPIRPRSRGRKRRAGSKSATTGGVPRSTGAFTTEDGRIKLKRLYPLGLTQRGSLLL